MYLPVPRVPLDSKAPLLAEWSIDFITDGTDGELLLTLTAEQTSQVSETMGYMDIKRIGDGSPNNIEQLTAAIPVIFEWPVTP